MQSVGRVEAQNRLMGMTDRELAMAMMYMEDRDRSRIFSSLSPSKAGRVREEIRLHGRLNIRYNQYLLAVDQVCSALAKSRPNSPFKSYIRPRRYRS
jgi:hypothetical protein